MEDTSLIALILAVIVAIERILKNIKYFKSSCCGVVMIEETQNSPKADIPPNGFKEI
jgi:hypothetical protein